MVGVSGTLAAGPDGAILRGPSVGSDGSALIKGVPLRLTGTMGAVAGGAAVLCVIEADFGAFVEELATGSNACRGTGNSCSTRRVAAKLLCEAFLASACRDFVGTRRG